MNMKEKVTAPMESLCRQFIELVDHILTRGAVEVLADNGKFSQVPIDSMSKDDQFYCLEQALVRSLKYLTQQGLTQQIIDRVVNNALNGKPKEQWLERLDCERQRAGGREM